MVLAYPDFTVVRPPGLSDWITDAMWWFWLRLQELEPTSQLGGIAAAKRGFHSTGNYNLANYPNDYSIREAVNRQGPWWRTKSSALDWTFPEAHQRDYARIAKYMQRLLASARDPNDPRLDVLYEFFGQADNDDHVEGWNEYQDRDATSDISHWFHIHFSVLRLFCGDFWAMWQVLTVLMGWTVAQWRASLPGATTPNPSGRKEPTMYYFCTDVDGAGTNRWAVVSGGYWFEYGTQKAGDNLASALGVRDGEARSARSTDRAGWDELKAPFVAVDRVAIADA